MSKAKTILVRLGVPDIVCSNEDYVDGNVDFIPEDAYLIGYEDENGKECEEDGTYLTLSHSITLKARRR